MDVRTGGIELHIEALVVDGLEGVGETDLVLLRTAAERELGRLITAEGLPSPLCYQGQTARVDGREATTVADGALAVGNLIARGIYGGFKG